MMIWFIMFCERVGSRESAGDIQESKDLIGSSWQG